MFSTMTTAPSTTIPKSRAPRESRFAGIWRRSKSIEANSNEKGIVAATISALRTLPRKKNRITATKIIPSVKLCITVWVVNATKSPRSRCGTISTPDGKKFLFRSLTLSWIPSIAVWASAPLRMRTIPSTTSSSSITFSAEIRRALPTFPRRILGPWVTTATSRTITGVPA